MNHAIRSHHHAQPVAQAANQITAIEFYRKLLAHDWYYAWSDDSSAYNAGQAADNRLEQMAKDSGPVHQWLYREFSKHHSTGESWGTTRHPLPAPPTELTASDALALRTELAKAEFAKKAISLIGVFLPAGFAKADPVAAVLEKAFILGFYYGNDPAPALIAHHPKLRKAWGEGLALVSDLAKSAI